MSNVKYKKRIHSWINDNLEIRESEISGTGVYATKVLEKGTLLTVWGGKIYTTSEVANMPSNSVVKTIICQVADNFFSGPFDDDSLDWSDLYNHSCDPNAIVVNSIFLVASRNILKDEEITFDYATCNNKFLNFNCECQSKICRKYISDSDRETFQNQGRYITNWPTTG